MMGEGGGCWEHGKERRSKGRRRGVEGMEKERG